MVFREISQTDVNRWMAGAVAGALATGVGHPIDSVKVRMQVSSKSRQSLFSLMYKIFQNEGLKAFFRGATAPVFMKLFTTSGFFFLNGYICDTMREVHRRRRNLPNDANVVLSVTEVAFGAGFAGILLSPVISPAELIKIQLQTDKLCVRGIATPKYRGVTDCISTLIRHKALFRGVSSTALRLIPGWGVYLGTYEYWNRLFEKDAQLGRNKVLSGLDITSRVMVGGAVAGCMAWIVSYPMDYIKTQTQAHTIERWNYTHTRKTSVKALPIREVIRITFAGRGLAGFYRGMWPCLIRSVPVNMTNFWAYEMAFQYLQDRS